MVTLGLLCVGKLVRAEEVYSNSFDEASSLAGFVTLGETFVGYASPPLHTVAIEGGQLAIRTQHLFPNGQGNPPALSGLAAVMLDTSTLVPAYPTLLSGVTDKITWAFNVSNEDGVFNNAFTVVLACTEADPFSISAHGYALKGGGMVGDRLALTRFDYGLGGGETFLVDITNGLGPLPAKGSFRITYEPRTYTWTLYGAFGTSYSTPRDVTVLLGSAVDGVYTNVSARHIGFVGQSTGADYFDNFSVSLGETAPSPTPEHAPDTVEFGNGIAYLLSIRDLKVYRWSVSQQRYLDPIVLAQAPSCMAYAPASGRLYLGYATGSITFFTDGAPGVEQSFATLAGGVHGLAAAADYLFASDPTGAWATHYVLDAQGTILSRKDWNYLSSEYVWNAVLRKMYFLRDDTSPNDILWENIDARGQLGTEVDSPYHTSTGIAHPVRVAPDGSAVILGTGRLFDGTSLNLIGQLPFSITDALWSDGQLYTLTARDGATELQLWTDIAHQTYRAISFAGQPIRLLDTGRDLLVITSVGGKPQFTLQAYAIATEPTVYPTPTPAPTPAPLGPEVTTGLAMLSQPGDYIGQGRSYLYTAPATAFTVSKNYANGVSISVGTDWSLSFGAPNGQPLTTQTYTGAVRFPFAGPNQPGLEIFGQGRGSNELTGFFTVRQIVYSGDTIASFWATFEQHSEGGTPALTGEIRINADPSVLPTPTPAATPAPAPPPDMADHLSPRLSLNGGATHRTRAPVFVVSGKARDNRSVARVEMQAGKGAFSPVAGTPSRWFQVVRLKPGKNTFTFRAVDTSGNVSSPRRVTIMSAR